MTDTRLGHRLRASGIGMGNERGRSIRRRGIDKCNGFGHHKVLKEERKGQQKQQDECLIENIYETLNMR